MSNLNFFYSPARCNVKFGRYFLFPLFHKYYCADAMSRIVVINKFLRGWWLLEWKMNEAARRGPHWAAATIPVSLRFHYIWSVIRNNKYIIIFLVFILRIFPNSNMLTRRLWEQAAMHFHCAQRREKSLLNVRRWQRRRLRQPAPIYSYGVRACLWLGSCRAVAEARACLWREGIFRLRYERGINCPFGKIYCGGELVNCAKIICRDA